MGKEKYLKEIEDLFKKSPVVIFDSIDRIIKNKKVVKQYTKQLVRNLILKGKVKKLTKGVYTIHDDISLSVFCFEPAYLGLQDALSIYDIWEQEAIPVIITTRNIRQGLRKILGHNILIRKLNKKYFFGFEYINTGKFYFPVSSVEKTFIDMVYFKENMDEDVLKEFRKRIDIKKLISFLRDYPSRTRKKVLDLYGKKRLRDLAGSWKMSEKEVK